MNEVTLLLGSNLNNPKKNIETAISLISNNIGAIKNRSELSITKPVEFASKNYFCNIALTIMTPFSPMQLLKNVKEIEREMGRVEDSSVKGGYEDRIIDVDIVNFNDIVFVSKNLQIPHQKHNRERIFSKKLLLQLK